MVAFRTACPWNTIGTIYQSSFIKYQNRVSEIWYPSNASRLLLTHAKLYTLGGNGRIQAHRILQEIASLQEVVFVYWISEDIKLLCNFSVKLLSIGEFHIDFSACSIDLDWRKMSLTYHDVNKITKCWLESCNPCLHAILDLYFYWNIWKIFDQC